MLIGYGRVSTEDQKLRLQRDVLKSTGCEKVFCEKVSGAANVLPVRKKLLEFAREGDVVVVWKLDRTLASSPAEPSAPDQRDRR